MFTLATDKSIGYAYSYIQNLYGNASTHYQQIWLFKGQVPQSFDDIPEEWTKNPAELARNCVSMMETVGASDFQPGSTTFNYTDRQTWIHARGNSWSPIFERWLLDTSMLIQRTHKGIDGYAEEGAGALFTSPAEAYVQDRTYYRDLVQVDVNNVAVYDYHPTRHLNADTQNTSFGRYVYNYPVIFEFTQEQYVDGVFMVQHTSSSYSVALVDVEAWDDTLNEGQGGWGESFQVALTDGGDPNVSNFEGVTTKKLRCTFGQTGSQSWYLNCIQWVSTQEPSDVTEPYDITWGLVTWTSANTSQSFHDYPELKFSTFENEKLFNQKQGYPLLLVDVGSPGDTATVILNNAKAVEPQDELTLLHMGLTFKDN